MCLVDGSCVPSLVPSESAKEAHSNVCKRIEKYLHHGNSKRTERIFCFSHTVILKVILFCNSLILVVTPNGGITAKACGITAKACACGFNYIHDHENNTP